jgi:uncharacterized protein YqeY
MVEIETAVNNAIADSGGSSMQDMCKLMGLLISQLDGNGDMGAVSLSIRNKLA